MKQRAAILQLMMISVFILASSGSASTENPAGRFSLQQTPQPLAVEKIREGIYMIKGGSGANSGFFIGEKEAVAIDAKMTEESTKQILDELAKLSSNLVKTILITHSDGDHVNGLTGFPSGLTIIAHEETKRAMDEAFKDEKLRAYLPNKVFADKWTLSVGKTKIELLHFGPAHTSGDSVVYFPKEKVAFVGDLLFMGREPLIHKSKNGTSFGLVKNLKAILSLDADIFIPGHGDKAGRADIESVIQNLEDKQAKIKTMIAEGKTLDEIKKAFGVEPGTQQAGRPRWLSLVEVIYQDLTEKNKVEPRSAGPESANPRWINPRISRDSQTSARMTGPSTTSLFIGKFEVR